MNRGILYGIAAYVSWGVLPIFWKLLQDVPPLETVGQRILWSFPLLLLLLVATKQLRSMRVLFSSWRILGLVALTALLLIANWSVYIYGINSGRIVETSLGYFMNPLVNVLLGVLFVHERLRRGQWASIGIAALGVLWLTFMYGSLPWIGLTLAFTFGFYALFKKLGSLEAMTGLTSEMGILFLPVVLLLAYYYSQPGNASTIANSTTLLLFMSTSVFTVGPLLLFGAAVRMIPLSVIGLLQYIAPTLQFLLGVFVYHEPFNSHLLVGYCLIWMALAVFTAEGLYHRRKLAQPTVSASSTSEAASAR